MDNSKILEDLGLPKQEAEAYLALLRLGGSLASTVAKEIGVKRTTIYAILKSLATKGVVLVYFRKSKRFYHPVPPHKLSSLFEKKLEALNGIIPFLQSADRKQVQVLGLRFIETKEELKKYYEDILVEYKNKKNKEYYVIGNDFSWENIDKDFFMKFRRDRSNLGIKVKLLFSYDSKLSVDIAPAFGREFRFFPKDYKLNCSIEILGDRLTLISHDLNAVAVVISIQSIVDAFKTIFEIMWDGLDFSEDKVNNQIVDKVPV